MNADIEESRGMPVTKEQLASDLGKIGIGNGDHVAVSLSLKSIGYVLGGADAFIDSLLDVVGSEGTIMMNAFTQSFPIAEINPDYVFDSESTIPYTGLVPRALIKRKESIRSRHPTCSVVATGRMAEYLTEGHDERSSPYLPYTKLGQIGGKYLSVGIGNNLVAIRHEAQRRAGLFVVPILMGVRYRNLKGEVILFVWVHPPCARKLPELVPMLEKKGLIKRGKIGRGASIEGSVEELIEGMSSLLKNDPTLTLCDDFFCMKCRELERRMNLYGRIANAAFFQESFLMRRVLYLRNKLLLRSYSKISFQNSRPQKTFSQASLLENVFVRTSRVVSKILNH